MGCASDAFELMSTGMTVIKSLRMETDRFTLMETGRFLVVEAVVTALKDASALGTGGSSGTGEALVEESAH